MSWVSLLGGGVLLYFGAEWLVGGASALALRLRVPQLVVGLTVVAYGTSAPEVIVGVQSARGGLGAVALGNVLGSNIANLGLILGVCGLIAPAKVDGALRRREVPMLVISAFVVPAVLLDGVVSLPESIALLMVAAGYTTVMVRSARAAAIIDATASASATAGAADAAGAPSQGSALRSLVIAVVGLGVLLLGGQLFVTGAVALATTFGLSERVVGLTIVAVGTSLPELITSAVAAKRGHSDLAIGNVVGSNIFNVYLCLGAAGLAGPVGAPLSVVGFDVAFLLLMTCATAWCLRKPRDLSRAEAGVLLASYVMFVAATVR